MLEKGCYHKDARELTGSLGFGGTIFGLAEATQRCIFVRLHIKNREKPGNLQQVMHALRQVKKFQLAARITHRGIAADQLANSRAIDIVHIVEIQDDFTVAFVDQFFDRAAESGTTLAQGDFSAEVYDCDVINLTACAL